MIFRGGLTGWSGIEMRAGVHVIRIKSRQGSDPDWSHDERKAHRDAARVRRWERKQKGRDLSREGRV